MRLKILLIFLVIGFLIVFFANRSKQACALKLSKSVDSAYSNQPLELEGTLKDAFNYLRIRQDNQAGPLFKKILISYPENKDALWGESEILRRKRDYKSAEEKLSLILKQDASHPAALNNLAFIRYKQGKFQDAWSMALKIIKNQFADKENKALAYMMLGMVNVGRSNEGLLFGKVRYGTQIKGYFLKARELAPDLAEVHLGLGSFYLLAPSLIGGNLNKAIEELEIAINIAPDYATANIRLAQAYEKLGLKEKSAFYLAKGKNLDPDNEALK